MFFGCGRGLSLGPPHRGTRGGAGPHVRRVFLVLTLIGRNGSPSFSFSGMNQCVLYHSFLQHLPLR